MAEYTPPKSESTGVKKTTEAPKATPVVEPQWNTQENQPVMVSEMIDAKSNAVSDLVIEAFDRYIRVLNGSLGVPIDKLGQEQLQFMKTLSNSLDLNFESYVLVTDTLVRKLRDNADTLTHDNVFRLVYHIPATAYKKQEVDRFKKYMTALLILSRNLTTRSRFAKLVDIASLVKGYKPNVAQNITMYLQRNYS